MTPINLDKDAHARARRHQYVVAEFERVSGLGTLYVTPSALAAASRHGIEPVIFFWRHAVGDWGELCAEDWQLNATAAERGDRVHSSYSLSSSEKVWVITEADRSATMLLLPEEY